MNTRLQTESAAINSNNQSEAEAIELTAFNKKIELDKFNTAMKLNRIRQIDTSVAITDASLMGSIFGMFTSKSSTLFLTHTAHLFMFPIAAAASIARAVLAWKEAYISRKTDAKVHAAVETVAALAITTAVVGGIVAAGIFGAISPMIFAGVLACKTLYHAGSSIYNAGKAAISNGEDKAKYLGHAKAHAIGAVATLLFTTAITAVMILAKPVMTFIGIVGSVVGVLSGIARGVKQHQEAKKLKAEAQEISTPEFSSSSNRIAATLGLTNQASPTVANDLAQDSSLSASREIFDMKRVYKNDEKQPLRQRSYSM